MKTLLAAAILSITAFSAHAQSVINSNTVNIEASGPVIRLPAERRNMSAEDFGKFVGSYQLANGKSISLFRREGMKYAVISGEEPHEIVVESSNSFVAKDRKLAVTLNIGDRDVSGQVLMVVPADHLASGEPRERVISIGVR